MNLNFRYRFEAAHRFTDASSKCSTPHGHSWWVTLTLQHEASEINLDKNFAVDFKDLKKQWKDFVDHELDHFFFLNEKDPLVNTLNLLQNDLRIKTTPGDPTTELLASLFFKKAQGFFNTHKFVKPLSILLEETPTNSVLVCKKDVDSFLMRVFSSETKKKEIHQAKAWWI